MNRDESLKLWRDGIDAWNKWAENLLRTKQALVKDGDWEIGKRHGHIGVKVGRNNVTKNWLYEAAVDFSSLHFQPKDGAETQQSIHHTPYKLDHNAISFAGFIFPGNTNFCNTLFDCEYVDFQSAQFRNGIAAFSGAQFRKCDADFRRAQFIDCYASFSGAQFSGGDTDFDGAQFVGGNTDFALVTFSGGNAGFSHVLFSGDTTLFNRAKFSGGIANFTNTKFESNVVNFTNTKFANNANFNLSTFEKPVIFKQAEFEKEADFSSVDSKKSFALTNATFHQVPNFTETAFHAPPILDEITVTEPLAYRNWDWNKKPPDPRPGGMSIFKIANDSADTRKYRALAKMAAEAKDYQNEMDFFANEQRCRRFWHDKPFGKGAGRFWFGLAYEKTSDFGRSFLRPIIGWFAIFGVFAFLYASMATAGKWAWGSALYVSFRHGLIFSGLTRSDSWDSAMKTLFGTDDAMNIPVFITWAMAFQPLISAVFIFLFLLAIRNQFKIR